MKIGEYHYELHGRHFRIYQCSFNDGVTTMSDPVRGEPFFMDREEARKRVYELNGWNYKPKSNVSKT